MPEIKTSSLLGSSTPHNPGANVLATVRKLYRGFTTGWDGSGTNQTDVIYRGAAPFVTLYLETSESGVTFVIEAAYQVVHTDQGLIDSALSSWTEVASIPRTGLITVATLTHFCPVYRVKSTGTMPFNVYAWQVE